MEKGKHGVVSGQPARCEKYVLEFGENIAEPHRARRRHDALPDMLHNRGQRAPPKQAVKPEARAVTAIGRRIVALNNDDVRTGPGNSDGITPRDLGDFRNSISMPTQRGARTDKAVGPSWSRNTPK
jgi:hypothetical protein